MIEVRSGKVRIGKTSTDRFFVVVAIGDAAPGMSALTAQPWLEAPQWLRGQGWRFDALTSRDGEVTIAGTAYNLEVEDGAVAAAQALDTIVTDALSAERS